MVAAAQSVTALEHEDESNSTVRPGVIVEDLPALEESTWQDVPLHPLSYTTFSICLISLILLCIGLVIWNVGTTIRNIRKPERVRKNVLNDAYKQIAILEKKRNVQGLYPLWVHIFSVRKQIHIADVSQEYISGVLYGAGFTTDRLREWNEFFTAVMAANYSPEIEIVAIDLFKESRIWLQRMEGIL